MAIDELDALLGEQEKGTPTEPLDAEPKAPADPVKKDPEVLSKEQQLANLQKAIAEANKRLFDTRKAAKSGKVSDEDELPKIDFEDPSSKAWDKHFNSKIQPVNDELAKEKEEIRTFALQEFLADKPNLSKDPEKIKRVMDTYEKVRTCSEKTREGVMIDLRKAYAAEFADEILNINQSRRVAEAQGDAIFADAGVSRGSTSYPSEHAKVERLSRDDEAVLAKWGMSIEQWSEMKKNSEKTK